MRGPGSPVVVGANWYRFRPGEHISHHVVASTCFLWVTRGRGIVRVNGVDYELTPGSLIRLPWRHAIAYRPDDTDPFHLGTIHLVPWHDDAVPVIARVAFIADDPLLLADYRQGSPAESVRVARTVSQSNAWRLVNLGTYLIQRFASSSIDERTLRAMGQLVLDESGRLDLERDARAEFPSAVTAMIAFVTANINRPLSVREIAWAGGCSAATAERLFVRHLGLPAIAWARRRRMEEAAVHLRTTALPVKAVARMVGYRDALYFSRVFTATFGVPPSRYAGGLLRP